MPELTLEDAYTGAGTLEATGMRGISRMELLAAILTVTNPNWNPSRPQAAMASVVLTVRDARKLVAMLQRHIEDADPEGVTADA